MNLRQLMTGMSPARRYLFKTSLAVVILQFPSLFLLVHFNPQVKYFWYLPLVILFWICLSGSALGAGLIVEMYRALCPEKITDDESHFRLAGIICIIIFTLQMIGSAGLHYHFSGSLWP